MGSTGPGRSSNGVIRRQRQGVLMRKERGQLHRCRGKAFLLAQVTYILRLILINVFTFQSSSHNNCFLVISTHRFLKHNVALGPIKILFCLFNIPEIDVLLLVRRYILIFLRESYQSRDKVRQSKRERIGPQQEHPQDRETIKGSAQESQTRGLGDRIRGRAWDKLLLPIAPLVTMGMLRV
jgi:hypothetical protein